MKQLMKRLSAFALVLLLALSLYPSRLAEASELTDKAQEVVNDILTNGETRNHVYVACLFDETSMTYSCMPLMGANEMERSRVTLLYGLGGLDGLTGKMLVDGFEGGNGQIRLTKTGIEANPVKEYEPQKDVGMAPLSFPFTHRPSQDADINRAYQVAQTLGGDLMDALLFLNNGHSYADINSYDYIMEMRYLLMSFMTESGGSGEIVNSYGYKYEVKYDTPTIGKVTITQVGNYQKLISGITTDDNTHYTYKAPDKWDTSSYKSFSNTQKKSQVFTYKLKKGYKKPRSATFEDGTKNNLPTAGTDKSDIEYLTWAHLILEADILYGQGITYSNYSDLYNKSVTDSIIVDTSSKIVTSIEGKLGLYPLSHLVFNQGIIGSDAYIYGVFPAEWFPNMQAFYLIMTVLALSVIILAVLYQIYRYGVRDGGSRIATRYAVVSVFYDVIVAAVCVAMFIPIFLIFLNLSQTVVDIFAGITAVSPRGIDGLFPGDSYMVIGGIIIHIAKLVIQIYLNVLYIVRRITLMGLFCFAPVFIVCYAFGDKGKSITFAWLTELIGNVLIQIVHAGVFALLCSVCSGLRGIEGLTMVACIIPVTNLFRGLITRGGGLTQSLAGKFTGSAIGATVGAASAVTGVVGNSAGAILKAGGHELAGSAVQGATSFGQGAMSTLAGAGLGMAMGSEDGTGAQMMSQGMRQMGDASKQVRRDPPRKDDIDENGGGNAVNEQIRNNVGTMGGDAGKFFSKGKVSKQNDGTVQSVHSSSFGDYDYLTLSEDGSMFKGKISYDDASSSGIARKNWNTVKSAYNKAWQESSDRGMSSLERQDYINSEMSKFGFESFHMDNRNGNTADVTFRNTAGAKGASINPSDGTVTFNHGKIENKTGNKA